jgi:hypothetical protein
MDSLGCFGLLGDTCFDYKALVLSSPWPFSRREFGWLKWLLWYPYADGSCTAESS